jgi:rubrerythrin
MTEITYTKIPQEFTDEGEPILVVVTCYTCNYKTFDEYPNVCPKCGITVNYEPEE